VTRGTLTRDYFEGLYERDEDPWGFASSLYEAQKYDATLEALGGRHFADALELGCSIGVFTARLAGHCERVLALDVSERAVARARERLTGLPAVEVRRATLPDELPARSFDLVVCSEILYYWEPETLRGALPALAGAVAPGGSLLAVHWTAPTRTYPLRGDEVHDMLIAELGLTPAYAQHNDRYRLDRFDARPSNGSKARPFDGSNAHP